MAQITGESGDATARDGHRTNVVYIVLDDMGFAATGAFGNDVIRTPTIDRLAEEGLRYNDFHTTAICSATRASLLTGVNHHKVGVSSLVDFADGTDRNLGHVSHRYSTAAEIFRANGYATLAIGKWHLSNKQTAAGPYDDWPLARGFDRYYGFLPAATDQFHPQLTQDNTAVPQPKTPQEGYHLSEDLVDHAIDYVYTQTTAYPDKPFFLYLAFGATHEPFQAPKAYVDAYRGAFHEGWDVLRRRWYERQRALGVIPASAELTPRNELARPWDALSADERALAERTMEAYAGFLTHTDAQIGRFISYLRESGQLDRTLIVLFSDNGASGEGGARGRFTGGHAGGSMFNEPFSIDDADLAFGVAHLDEVGGEFSHPHYAIGWANALNAPFSWYKKWTYEGGVKDDLIIRWPEAVHDPGAVRTQYAHVSDITPTVVDALGLEKPAEVNGVAQGDFTGTSFAATFGDSTAPSAKRIQYYEMLGNRSIYKDGWKAVANHYALADGRLAPTPYEDDAWQLYHVAEDYSEAHDVAAEHPGKLRELQDAFLVEASANGVLPLFAGFDESGAGEGEEPAEPLVFGRVFRPFVVPPRHGFRRVANAVPEGPRVVDVDFDSHRVLARLEHVAGDAGVIVSKGDRFGGFALYIDAEGRLRYVYNANRARYFEAVSEDPVPAGEVQVGYELAYASGAGEPRRARVELLVDGAWAGATEILDFNDMSGRFVLGATPDTAVSPRYEAPFAYTGIIEGVRVEALAGAAGASEAEAEGRKLERALRED